MSPAAARPWRAALFLTALAVAVRLPFLHAPLDRDEGCYAYASAGMLHGLLPYRDANLQRPPLLFACYLPVAALANGVTERFRLLALVYPVATTLLVWRLGVALGGAGVGVLAGALCAVLSADPSVDGWTLNAEMVMLPFTVAAALAWWRALQSRRRRTAFASGLWLGAAALIKPVALPQLLLAAAACDGAGRRRAGAAWRLVLAHGAGGAAAGAAGVLAVVLAGLGPDAARSFREGVGYVTGVSLGMFRWYGVALGNAALTQGAVWVLAAAGCCASAPRRNSSWAASAPGPGAVRW